ncbi:AraC family transcriptional regulator [Roseomonas populi]|uniref:AraC family transcriptional regulator n=1 Tax=Roseomonas populi TaxID=3121582 RepID=A0ABT1X6K5_9PROT|nr:AraC family transcriptional regulator [Roseomonas pecuniae]MCR0983401.1 AraC family transcriptional regulator [Roseomonas pecuniae]
MGQDALSEVLRAVRLTGAVFFRVEAREPWAAEAPPAAACAPHVMPGAQHVIEYHLIHRGACWGGLVGAAPVRLEAGDIIAFPQGDAHVLSSAPGLRQVPDLALYREAAAAAPLSLRLGAAGEPTACVICGFLGCDARPFNPLLEALPRMLHHRAGRDGPSWMGQLASATMAEAARRRIGGEAILARLSELLFAELVRRHVEDLPAEGRNWFAALRDPHVGRALNLLHGRAAEPWTLDALARDVGLSRSTLAERFARLVGCPPMGYLGRWRLQLGAGLLAGGGLPVAQVALRVGYESEEAFSRAFRRMTGVPPAAWRRASREGRSGPLPEARQGP